MGCTLNCDPNWLSVFSPRIASTATRALNFGLYCFLVVVIDLSSVNDYRRNLSLLPGLNSGDHYIQAILIFRGEYGISRIPNRWLGIGEILKHAPRACRHGVWRPLGRPECAGFKYYGNDGGYMHG